MSTARKRIIIALTAFLAGLSSIALLSWYLWNKTDLILFYLTPQKMQDYLNNSPNSNLRLFAPLVPNVPTKTASPIIFGRAKEINFNKNEVVVRNGLLGAKLYFDKTFSLFTINSASNSLNENGSLTREDAIIQKISSEVDLEKARPQDLMPYVFSELKVQDNKIYFKSLTRRK